MGSQSRQTIAYWSLAMVFNKNIPQPGDRLSQSQQDLLNNNLQLNTSFSVNHYAFDDQTVNNGMHHECQLVEQLANPNPIVGTDSLYTKVSGAIPKGELFYQRGTNGVPNTPIQLTFGDPLGLANGYTFLPGAILIQWGQTTASGTGTRNILFAASNINFPTSCFHVFAQMETLPGAAFAWGVQSVSTTGFSLRTVSTSIPSGTPFSWFAIGV